MNKLAPNYFDNP